MPDQPRPPQRYTITLDPDLADWIDGSCRFGPGPRIHLEEGIVLLLRLAREIVMSLAVYYAKEEQRK